MRPASSKFMISAALILIGLALLDRHIAHDWLTGMFLRPVKPVAAILDKSGRIKSFIGALKNFSRLERENNDLKLRQADLMGQLAHLQALERENQFLRSAVGLADRLDTVILPAGIFSLSGAPVGDSALLNKGRLDGVTVDSVVISGQREIVGRVVNLFDHSARLLLVTDPVFSTAGTVLGNNTSGIIRGDLESGLRFELITQSDPIQTGDTVVTKGGDEFPAGLIIGTVQNISGERTNVFKHVAVRPALWDVNLGQVLVIIR